MNPDSISADASRKGKGVCRYRLNRLKHNLGLSPKNRYAADDGSYDYKSNDKPTKPAKLIIPEGSDLLPIIGLGIQNLASMRQIGGMDFSVGFDTPHLNRLLSPVLLPLLGELFALELNMIPDDS